MEYSSFTAWLLPLLLTVTTWSGLCSAATVVTTDEPPQQNKIEGNSQCTIEIGRTQLHKFFQWPLVYHDLDLKTSQLYNTTLQEIKGETTPELSVVIEPNAKALLSCGSNYFKRYRNTKNIEVQCNQHTGNLIVLNPPHSVSDAPEERKANDLTCDLRVIEEVLQPVTGCGTGMTATHFGYQHPQGDVFILGEACYNTQEGRTYFAHIQLGPQPFLHQHNGRYLNGPHPDGRYKIELLQSLRFDEIYGHMRDVLGTEDVPSLTLQNFVGLQLLPNAQFQAVKKLGWNYFVGLEHANILNEIHQAIHDYASMGKDNIEIFVGSHGVRKHTNGAKTMEHYLTSDPDRFPVPEYIWLVVKNGTRGVVFVVANMDINDTPQPSICPSNCEHISWLNKVKFTTPGGVLCCSYQDASRIVKEIPASLHITELL